MTALIIGADYIDSIKREFNAVGIDRIEHWTGRKVGDIRRALPRDTALLVVLYDRANHGLVRHVVEEAQRLGLPVLYCRRTVPDVREKLSHWASAVAA